MGNSIQQRCERWQLEELLRAYPGLRLVPVVDSNVRLAGTLAFAAQAPGHERIEDAYTLEMSIPERFPFDLPLVRETGGRIPRTFHALADGSLCLGSPTRQRLELIDAPTLPAFMERCVIPYLYGFSLQEKHGTLPFGELAHGRAGLRKDFAELFGAGTEAAAEEFVRLASLKKRAANKYPCPCGSNRRLGRCHHHQVNRFRNLLGRLWFREQYVWLTHYKQELRKAVPKREYQIRR